MNPDKHSKQKLLLMEKYHQAQHFIQHFLYEQTKEDPMDAADFTVILRMLTDK